MAGLPADGTGRQRAAPVPGRRRKWVSRAVVVVILCLQATMSLHLANTASPAEALCLNAGHAEWGGLLKGGRALASTACGGGSATYPALGWLAARAGGLAAARAASLAATLVTTSLLYSLTRQMFNERVALLAAALFAVASSTITTGDLATPGAASLSLLALAAWIIVRTASSHLPGYLIAAPVAMLAVATSYQSVLVIPALAALTALASTPHRGYRTVAAPLAFAAATGAAAVLLALVDPALPHAVWAVAGPSPRWDASAPLGSAAAWAGPLLGLSLLGMVVYTVRAQNEPGEHIAPPGSRSRRLALGAVLTGTAVLAVIAARPASGPWPGQQVGLGLLFAAPMAGVGLARVIGDHFRRAQIGVAVWGALLALGLVQSSQAFGDWPGIHPLVVAVTPYLRPGARYLVESPETLMYYLRSNPGAAPGQFSAIRNLSPTALAGRSFGDSAYVKAVQAGRYSLIAYNGSVAPNLDHFLARILATDPRYRLASVVPMPDRTGTSTYYVWVAVPGQAR